MTDADLEGLLDAEDHASPNGAPVEIHVDDTRPLIHVTTDEHRVATAAIRALAARSRSLYSRSCSLVHVIRPSAPPGEIGACSAVGAPLIAAVGAARLREVICACARLAKWDARAKRPAPTHPPDWLPQAILARGEWPGVRHLAAVSEIPVLRPDGSVHADPGHDERTGILYLPSAPFPALPEPTREAAKDALLRLEDVVGDFPFASPAHRSAWLAGLLTAAARHSFDGPAPLFLVDANTRGSGKSLLVDVIAAIVTGRPMARMAASDDDVEVRKRITAIAREGVHAVLVDNIGARLGSPSLDAALTSRVWGDRVLGESAYREWPLTAVWYATGNNVQLGADTSRRCVHVRLESPSELPEERTDFAHADLLSWCTANRAGLLVDALTIVRASILDRADLQLAPWGSYEGWTTIRRALVRAGAADPAETRAELRRLDSDAGSLADLHAGWIEICGDAPGRTAAEALASLAADSSGTAHGRLRHALSELCGGAKSGGLPSSRALGKLLSRVRGRVVSGRSLAEVGGSGHHGRAWGVRAADAEEPRPAQAELL